MPHVEGRHVEDFGISYMASGPHNRIGGVALFFHERQDLSRGKVPCIVQPQGNIQGILRHGEALVLKKGKIALRQDEIGIVRQIPEPAPRLFLSLPVTSAPKGIFRIFPKPHRQAHAGHLFFCVLCYHPITFSIRHFSFCKSHNESKPLAGMQKNIYTGRG